MTSNMNQFISNNIKRFTIIGLCIFAFVSANAQAPTNLINNPGFEEAVLSNTNPSKFLLTVDGIYDEKTKDQPTFGAVSVPKGMWVGRTNSAVSKFAMINQIPVTSSTMSHTPSKFMNLIISDGNSDPQFENWTNCMVVQKLISSVLNTNNRYILKFWAKVPDNSVPIHCNEITVFLKDGSTSLDTSTKLDFPLSGTVPLAKDHDWHEYTYVFDLPNYINGNTDITFNQTVFGFGINAVYAPSASGEGNVTLSSQVYIDAVSLLEERRKNYTLSGGENYNNKSYWAQESIILKPGFSFTGDSTASKQTFRAAVDPSLLLPPTTGNYLIDGVPTDKTYLTTSS